MRLSVLACLLLCRPFRRGFSLLCPLAYSLISSRAFHLRFDAKDSGYPRGSRLARRRAAKHICRAGAVRRRLGRVTALSCKCLSHNPSSQTSPIHLNQAASARVVLRARLLSFSPRQPPATPGLSARVSEMRTHNNSLYHDRYHRLRLAKFRFGLLLPDHLSPSTLIHDFYAATFGHGLQTVSSLISAQTARHPPSETVQSPPKGPSARGLPSSLQEPYRHHGKRQHPFRERPGGAQVM